MRNRISIGHYWMKTTEVNWQNREKFTQPKILVCLLNYK